jgi:hypothetical protein
MNNWRSVKFLLSFSSRSGFNKAVALAVDVLVMLWCGTYFVTIPRSLERAPWIKNQAGHPVSLEEEILILSSFNSNAEYKSANDEGQRLICVNLPPEVNIAIVNPDDVVPRDVIVAEAKGGGGDVDSEAYTYRLAKCTNSNEPDHIRQ